MAMKSRLVLEKKRKKTNSNFPKKKELPQQTNPPSTPVTELFPPGEFPEAIYGEQHLKKVHRQVWKYVVSIVKPEMLMTDIRETLENSVRKLISENGLQAGIAFPSI
ncbi:unnamed protein product [Arabis nemorensis]|uniref:Uncharacterized protein n=1 Tax=Arabis nemorensis TaxID=586526 RepID=A0A565CQL6_9BRAS|nr:unnamed protein product [Arabis nemorensis]